MKKTVMIGNKKVKFNSSAGILRLYRKEFGRDLLIDMAKVEAALQRKNDGSSVIPIENLQIFEDLAYIYAKHADPEGVPDTPEEWLDQFEIMDIYSIYPEILSMWVEENKSVSKLKKKEGKSTGN